MVVRIECQIGMKERMKMRMIKKKMIIIKKKLVNKGQQLQMYGILLIKILVNVQVVVKYLIKKQELLQFVLIYRNMECYL